MAAVAAAARRREQLRLARTIGRRGWQVQHASRGDGFVLAALGTIVAQPRRAFALTALVRLLRLWHEGLPLRPEALRVALCMNRRVRIGAVTLDAAVAAPAAPPAPLVRATRLRLAARRGDPALQPAPQEQAWTVLRLAPASVEPARRLAAALAAAPAGALAQFELAADTAAPAALRAGFDLRIDVAFDFREGYVTIVPALQVVLPAAGA
jgi:hypothetical protein